MRIFAFLLLLVASCRSETDGDWSFKRRCDMEGGTYTRRSEPSDPNPIGERCLINYGHGTDTPEGALDLCEAYFPFKIVQAIPARRTTCEAEATLVCKEKWVQIYGRCYYVEKKRMKYREARKFCKKQGSKIAFMQTYILIRHWAEVWASSAYDVWVDGRPEDVSEDLGGFVRYKRGDDMMLTFDGMGLDVRSLSVLKVDGHVEKAMPICEYTPNAASNYRFARDLELVNFNE